MSKEIDKLINNMTPQKNKVEQLLDYFIKSQSRLGKLTFEFRNLREAFNDRNDELRKNKAPKDQLKTDKVRNEVWAKLSKVKVEYNKIKNDRAAKQAETEKTIRLLSKKLANLENYMKIRAKSRNPFKSKKATKQANQYIASVNSMIDSVDFAMVDISYA